MKNFLLAHTALIRAKTRDVAFLYRMPVGIPGDINRAWAAIVEPNVIDADNPPTAYGRAVKMVGGYVQPIDAADVAGDIIGVLARPYPTNSGQDGLGTSTPPTSGPCDVLKSGYIIVQLYGATAAAANGAVYVRISDAGAGEVVGGFEAAADGGDTILMAGAYFRGPADSQGMTEIAFAFQR